MTFRQTIEKLAQDISKRAGESATPFVEAVDALKALTALYGTLLKDKSKPDEESDGFTMADARSMIEETEHDTSAVRGRRGSAYAELRRDKRADA